MTSDEIAALDLAEQLDRVRPTAEEIDLILDAVRRYGLKDPSPADVLGMKQHRKGDHVWHTDPSRDGIWSIVIAMARVA